jgi:hypothetical protein
MRGRTTLTEDPAHPSVRFRGRGRSPRRLRCERCVSFRRCHPSTQASRVWYEPLAPLMLSDHAHGGGRGDRLLPATLLLLAESSCLRRRRAVGTAVLARPAAAVCGDGTSRSEEATTATRQWGRLPQLLLPSRQLWPRSSLHTTGCGAALTPAQLSRSSSTSSSSRRRSRLGDGYEDRRFFTDARSGVLTRAHPALRPEVSYLLAANGGHLSAGPGLADFAEPVQRSRSGVPVVEWARGQAAAW